MKRRITQGIVIAMLVPAVVGAGALVAMAAATTTPAITTTMTAAGPTAPNRGQFVSFCLFSHRAPDDPIVHPGVPGASHSHDFLGNDTTNATSTYDTLRAGTTSCRRTGDTAGYWVPTLMAGGIAVNPAGANAYYLTRGKSAIKPFPAGLRVVAGDAKATAPQPLDIVSYSCGPNGGVSHQSSPPVCPDGIALRMHVRFPDCWNGRDLDSADHKSHMAYSTRGRCPASHPVAVPGLQLNVIYPVRGGSSVTLSSGPAYTAHGDFFNAWNQDALTKLVDSCLNARTKCGHR